MTHGSHEVLKFGRNVSMGYLYDADGTAEAMDERGWLHTGDIGQADRSGFLYVSSRNSDLLLTAGGASVPPQALESTIKVGCMRLFLNSTLLFLLSSSKLAFFAFLFSFLSAGPRGPGGVCRAGRS